MKLSEQTYELIIDLLEAEYNSSDDEEHKKTVAVALDEVDTLGVY